MLPPGISFNAVSKKAIEASKAARLPRAFWDWTEIIAMNASGYWPYTPSTHLLYGLVEALDMILGGGTGQVVRTPSAFGSSLPPGGSRLGPGSAVRRCCRLLAGTDRRDDAAGFDADAIRKLIYEKFGHVARQGLGKVRGAMFRIGHLGEANDLTLMATLSGCEMGLKLAGVPLAGSGVVAAMEHLSSNLRTPATSRSSQ